MRLIRILFILVLSSVVAQAAQKTEGADLNLELVNITGNAKIKVKMENLKSKDGTYEIENANLLQKTRQIQPGIFTRLEFPLPESGDADYTPKIMFTLEDASGAVVGTCDFFVQVSVSWQEGKLGTSWRKAYVYSINAVPSGKLKCNGFAKAGQGFSEVQNIKSINFQISPN